MLNHVIKAMKLKMSEEFPSSDLKTAYDLLGKITGQTTTNEILDGIFKILGKIFTRSYFHMSEL